MYRLRYRIKTCSPIVITATSGDMNMVATEKFIPGTIVLGVLANRFIERENADSAHENDTFYHWFLKGEIRFSNAYIVFQDEYGDHSQYPTPFSVEQEKYGTEVYDLILDKPKHDVATKYVGNFCRLEKDTVSIQSVETSVNFHHERDKIKGNPKMNGEDGVIFNFESINQEQIFDGDIVGEESDLKELVQICGKEWSAFVGRSRNAQYGAVEFKIIDDNPIGNPIPVSNQLIQTVDDNGNSEEFISMALKSNLILYNEYGFPSTNAKDLVKELKKYFDEVEEIEKAIVKKTEVESFVSIWQLKKPSETCFAAGSTFLLKLKPGNHQIRTNVQIGERTHEGFGHCVFGLHTHSILSLRDEVENDVSKPGEPMPDTVKEIIKSIIKELIQEKIELDAINKMNEFVRLPSNSLIAKLEAMVIKREKRSDFVAGISKFRKIAFDQLKRCVCKDCNLLEFLAAFTLPDNSIQVLQEEEFDSELLTKIKSTNKNREYVLYKEIKKDLDLHREFTDDEILLLLQHAHFRFSPINWEVFFRNPNNNQIRLLCKEIDFKIEDCKRFTNDLTLRYYTTFFSMMRKRAISESEDDVNDQ